MYIWATVNMKDSRVILRWKLYQEYLSKQLAIVEAPNVNPQADKALEHPMDLCSGSCGPDLLVFRVE